MHVTLVRREVVVEGGAVGRQETVGGAGAVLALAAAQDAERTQETRINLHDVRCYRRRRSRSRCRCNGNQLDTVLIYERIRRALYAVRRPPSAVRRQPSVVSRPPS